MARLLLGCCPAAAHLLPPRSTLLQLAGFHKDGSGENLEMPADKVGEGRGSTISLCAWAEGRCSRDAFCTSWPAAVCAGWPAGGAARAQTLASPLCPPRPQVNRLVLEVAGEQLNSALSNPFFGML